MKKTILLVLLVIIISGAFASGLVSRDDCVCPMGEAFTIRLNESFICNWPNFPEFGSQRDQEVYNNYYWLIKTILQVEQSIGDPNIGINNLCAICDNPNVDSPPKWDWVWAEPINCTKIEIGDVYPMQSVRYIGENEIAPLVKDKEAVLRVIVNLTNITDNKPVNVAVSGTSSQGDVFNEDYVLINNRGFTYAFKKEEFNLNEFKGLSENQKKTIYRVGGYNGINLVFMPRNIGTLNFNVDIAHLPDDSISYNIDYKKDSGNFNVYQIRKYDTGKPYKIYYQRVQPECDDIFGNKFKTSDSSFGEYTGKWTTAFAAMSPLPESYVSSDKNYDILYLSPGRNLAGEFLDGPLSIILGSRGDDFWDVDDECHRDPSLANIAGYRVNYGSVLNSKAKKIKARGYDAVVFVVREGALGTRHGLYYPLHPNFVFVEEGQFPSVAIEELGHMIAGFSDERGENSGPLIREIYGGNKVHEEFKPVRISIEPESNNNILNTYSLYGWTHHWFTEEQYKTLLDMFLYYGSGSFLHPTPTPSPAPASSSATVKGAISGNNIEFYPIKVNKEVDEMDFQESNYWIDFLDCDKNVLYSKNAYVYNEDEANYFIADSYFPEETNSISIRNQNSVLKTENVNSLYFSFFRDELPDNFTLKIDCRIPECTNEIRECTASNSCLGTKSCEDGFYGECITDLQLCDGICRESCENGEITGEAIDSNNIEINEGEISDNEPAGDVNEINVDNNVESENDAQTGIIEDIADNSILVNSEEEIIEESVDSGIGDNFWMIEDSGGIIGEVIEYIENIWVDNEESEEVIDTAIGEDNNIDNILINEDNEGIMENVDSSINVENIFTIYNPDNFVSGKINQAYSFNGFGDYIEIGNNPVLQVAGSDFSLCAWFKTSGDEEDIISNGVFEDGDYLLMSYQGKLRGHVWYQGNWNVLDSNAFVADNEWHLGCQVVDANTNTLYVDGILDNSIFLSGSKVAGNGDVIIGSRDASYGNYNFQGLLDDVRIYNRALSSEEILNLYNLQDVSEGLVGFEGFDVS